MDQSAEIATIMAAYVLESSDDEDQVPKKRKPRSVWTKNWLLRRPQNGFYAKMLAELRAEEPYLYRNFLRMNGDQFDHLLGLVSPYIQKKDTNMRRSISAGERLALTLRYLATGEHFRSLQILFRIEVSTISKIIPEVLDAIYTVLVGEYLQVNKLYLLIACTFLFLLISIKFCFRRRAHRRLGNL